MKRLLLTALCLLSAQLHLRTVAAVEGQAVASPAPEPRGEQELSVRLLYSGDPEVGARPDPALLGDWDAKLGGGLAVLLRLRKTAGGFTGTLEFNGDDGVIVAPLIKRKVVPGGLKFTVPLETDAGEIAFELALDGGVLKGHVIGLQELAGRQEIRFTRAGPAKDPGGAKVAGRWKGSVDGSEPVEITLKVGKEGLDGTFSISILEAKEVVPLADARGGEDRVRFAVREDGEVIWEYELVVEGDVLTGYRRQEEGRIWVAFRRIP